MSVLDLESKLREFGQRNDDDIPLISSLLMLGSLDLEARDTAPYAHHIAQLHEALDNEITNHPQLDEQNILLWRLERLNAVLRGTFGYDGDQESYDDADAINLLTVIDRRRGIPVALGVLYMDLAEHAGWPIFGLNFPGHFLLRLDDGAQRLIFDPFHGGQTVQANDMRQLLKVALGERAELHHDYYNPVTKRDVLLRFYNNRKTRFITTGHYQYALQTLQHQIWIAPKEPRLYYEAGILSIKEDRIRDAMGYLNEFVQLSNDARTVSEARDMIRGLQRLLQ